jgi:competence protein ComEC
VLVEGKLTRPPALSNPDVFNYRAYLENQGIGAGVFVRQADALVFSPPAAGRSWVDWIRAAAEQLHRRAGEILDRHLEPEAAALNRSIFLGEAEWLDRGVREDFTRCGLAHIFAVSGLNVAILAWVLDIFIRLFGLKPAWRSIILMAAAAVFCAVVGFQASVVRATVMLTALLAPAFLRYKVEPLTALAAAALVILGLDPRALWQASFQLSFVCMFSIILLKPPLDNWLNLDEERGSLRRRRFAAFANRYVLPEVKIVVAAQLGVMPLLAHYFHMVPVVGVASNFLAAPLVWAIMATEVILLVIGAFAPAAAWVFGGALTLLSHLLLELVRSWSVMPAVSLSMPSWPLWVCALYYAVLFGWAALPREPSPFFHAKQRARLLLALVAIAAWLVWAPVVLRGAGTGLRATFLDVGQGDSCLLELPGGPVVLVDGGDAFVHAGERIIAPFLESHGIERLDAVIATHPDSDHIGGLPEVFREVFVAWLIEGPAQSQSLIYGELIETAKRRGARQDRVFAGDWIEAPMGTRLLFLHPPQGAAYSNHNNLSLVVMVDWGACEILIPGDIERPGERDLLASGADLSCDVLKVAHHGGATATSVEFLERARPTLAVISCGRENRYGHPSPDVLERLTSAGITVARTDRDGAVTIRSNGRTLEWRWEGKP